MGVIKMKVFCLLCVIFCISGASREEGRKPRLFLVSTSSTTLTVSTASVCYIALTGGSAFTECSGRKKRRGIPEVEDMEDKLVKPSWGEWESDTESDDDLGRAGRFFLYWITTTSISTTATYTKTFSVTKAECTPPGASQCLILRLATQPPMKFVRLHVLSLVPRNVNN